MKLQYKKIIFFLSFFLWCNLSSYADLHQASVITPVSAQSSAQRHNNLGTAYFKEGDLFAAIKEYRIAIGINPDSQTTATYFNNLGKVYLVLGSIQVENNIPTNPDQNFALMAQTSFEHAILGDCMKLEYYQNLVKAYELTGVASDKCKYFLANRDKNPFNVIPAAIILKKHGKADYANMLLDDFVTENPDIIISRDLNKLIKKRPDEI